MIKSFFFVSVASLVSVSAHAEFDLAMLHKYYTGNFTFNGKKAAVNPNVPGYNIDNKKRTVATAPSTEGSYTMAWNTEDVDFSPVLSVTEARVFPLGKDVSDINARTSTFSGDKLKSSTVCSGRASRKTVIGRPVIDTDMKCVTATKESCGRLLKAYEAEAARPGSTLAKKAEDLKKQEESCTSTLGSFKRMALAFGNQSQAIVDSDTKRIKDYVDKTTGSGIFDPTNLGKATTEGSMDKMADTYTNSVDGIQTLTYVLRTCELAQGDFEDAPRRPTSAAPTNTGSSKTDTFHTGQ